MTESVQNRKLCSQLRCLIFTTYASDYKSDSDSIPTVNQQGGTYSGGGEGGGGDLVTDR